MTLREPSRASQRALPSLAVTSRRVSVISEEHVTSLESLQRVAEHAHGRPLRGLRLVMSAALDALSAPSPGVGESKSSA